MDRIDLPIEEIIEKYESGISQLTLANEYNVSQCTMNKRILEYYFKTGKPKPVRHYPNSKKELPITEIIEKYESGTSAATLANEYGVSAATIHKRINEYYEMNNKTRPLKHYLDNSKLGLPMEEIVRKYESGILQATLANDYNVSEQRISRIIEEYYISKGKSKPKILKGVSTIVEFLHKGLSIEEIKEIAAKRNVIIPENIINKALDKSNKAHVLNNHEER